jgi:hypothetical protein
VKRAHQLALGRKRQLRRADETGVERFGFETGLAGCDDQRAFGRIALHRPLSLMLLQHRIVGAVGDGECTHQFGLQRTIQRPSPFTAHLALRRVTRPPKVTRPLAVTARRTVISFLVSVPVLSDAMTFAEPSVSTAARWRTMAFRFAMR